MHPSRRSAPELLEGLAVLIVEDEPIIGFALEDILQSLGCEHVLLAGHLAEAEQILADGQIQAAVLDVNIHGLRSYGIADRLSDAGVPFIFATGYGDAQHPARHASVPTLTKPYSLADVRAALASVLERS